MQVLVKNPFVKSASFIDVSESFWSSQCLYPFDNFQISSLINLTNEIGLSPFLFLDARVAFLVSQSQKSESLCKNLDPLALIGVHFFSGEGIISVDNQPHLEKYRREYLPASPVIHEQNVSQVITFGPPVIDELLWQRLEVGGFYLLGCIGKEISLDGYAFEAFGKLWPVGEPTEFGWRFHSPELGLEDFEFAKIRKLR